MNWRDTMAAAFGLLLAACSPQEAAKPAAPATEGQPTTPGAPAAPPADAAAQSADQGPPTVNGIYIDKGACPGEGCYLKGRIKAYEAADLYDTPGADATVSGRIAAGEWVEILATENRLIPLRGVVREGRKHFATGDVVHMLTSQGEGCFDIWSKGAIHSWCDPEAVGDPAVDEIIDWDDGSANFGEWVAGLFVQVKRADGQVGWLRGTDTFGCTGYQDRDPDCPPLPQ